MSKKHSQIYPKPGWVEQDPIEIWQNVKACIKEVIKIGKADVNKIDSIGITNQRESLVIWDKETGNPLYNVIVWQDRRSSNLVGVLKRLRRAYKRKNRARSGCLFYRSKDHAAYSKQ